MSEFHPALPHGALEEVFPDVFFVTGTRKGELLGGHWHFSRNMTVIRHGGDLALVNSVRLGDDGLAALEALGNVRHVIRIGALHGMDDAFYLDRYDAEYWAPDGLSEEYGIEPDHVLRDGEAGPFPGTSFFGFAHSKLPEFIVKVDREGGILVACDALQNWREPDEFFSDESRAMMTEMGFFTPANVGPVWRQVNEPGAADFERLLGLEFRHALCGHGEPLRDTARDDYRITFGALFGI